MSRQPSFRGQRMREAMESLGLSSGQVAYRMNVSGAAVRGWTTGRRGIDPDALARFARIVAYPVEYFMYPEHSLPANFALIHELRKLSEQAGELTKLLEHIEGVRQLSEQVRQLVEKVGSETGYQVMSDEQAVSYLRDAHGLGPESVSAIRRILGIPQE